MYKIPNKIPDNPATPIASNLSLIKTPDNAPLKIQRDNKITVFIMCV